MDIKKVFCYCFRRGRFFNKLLPILLQLLVVVIVWQIFQSRQNGGALSLADRAEGESVPLCTPGDYTKGKTLYMKAIMNEVNVIGANAADDKPQPHFLSAELLVRDLEHGSLILYPAGTPVIFGSSEGEGNAEGDYRDDDTEMSEIRQEEERKKNETGGGEIEVSSGSRKDGNLTVDLLKVDANASKAILEQNAKESTMMAISANILSGGSGVAEMKQDGADSLSSTTSSSTTTSSTSTPTTTTASPGEGSGGEGTKTGDQMDIAKILQSLNQGGTLQPDQIQQLLQLQLKQGQGQGQGSSGASGQAKPLEGGAGAQGVGAGTPGSSGLGTSVGAGATGGQSASGTSGTGVASTVSGAQGALGQGASGLGTTLGAAGGSLSSGGLGLGTGTGDASSAASGTGTGALGAAGSATGLSPGSVPTTPTGPSVPLVPGTAGSISTSPGAGLTPTGVSTGQAGAPSTAEAAVTTVPAASLKGEGGTPDITPQDNADADGQLFSDGFEDRVKNFQVDYYGKHLGSECVNATLPNYVMNSQKYCDQFTKIDILYVIGMSPQNEERRNKIRETFAKPDLVPNNVIAHIFIVGKTSSAAYQATLDKEYNQFGDIVQGDFMDDKDTMTHKTLLGLKWARQFCRKAKFVMKIDEDILVDSEKLLLGFQPAAEKEIGPRTMMCALVPQGPMPRTGSRAFPRNLFPNTPMLKPFCKGFAVTLTQSAISSILAAAVHTPLVTVEDIYVFGILPTLAGNIDLYDVGQKRAFHDYGKEVVICYDKELNKCPMLASRAMSARLEELWKYITKRGEQPHEDWLNERSLWPDLAKYKSSFIPQAL